MAEKETKEVEPKGDGHTHPPMDPKKKKILIGVSAFGILIVGYLWYRNQNSTASSSATTTPSSSGLTSYIPYGGGTTSDTGNTGQPVDITNTNSPTFTSSPSITDSFSPSLVAPAGGTTVKSPTHKPAKKGGKTQIHHTAIKPSVHVSGGTSRISGTTKTAKATKVSTIHRLPASHSGNFIPRPAVHVTPKRPAASTRRPLRHG
jgi:hypothetical protein